MESKEEDDKKTELNAREIETALNWEKSLEMEAEMEVEGTHWGEEGVCSYSEGYKTQNVYLCKRCSANSNRKVVVCFGCSLDCHTDHDILELWKKRKIRCDCGTNDIECKIRNDGFIEPNLENKYIPEQNFEGLFCWCHQPYNYDDALLVQCIACSDWFHDTCILNEWKEKGINAGTEIHDDLLDEATFVCRDCIKPELFAYVPLLQWKDDFSVERLKESAECVPPGQVFNPHSTFFVCDFEDYLCKCPKCTELFKDYFLEEDAHEDEEVNRENKIKPIRDQMEKSMEDAVKKNFSHNQQIALSNGFLQFKETVVRALSKKYDSGKRVIDENDIEEIKEELKRQKKGN